MNLEVDQLLHGYAGGHRLLESSRKLSQDAQRKLLLLTDLSGPSPVPGFDSYLTGFWIESDGLFAFARTWYAPEMERPGCVWTHTLLLEPSLFRILQRPSELASLFRRPTSSDFGDYARPVQTTDASRNDVRSSLDSLRHQLHRILPALYGQPERAVICPTRSAESADAVVMWIWNHQPHELQRHFRFSSGSLANRNRDAFEFDLQFMPVQVRHRVNAGTEIVVDEDDAPVLTSQLHPGIDELIESPEHVTDFLHLIDADLPGSRRAFASVLELHSRLAHAGPLTTIDRSNLSFVSEAFPDAMEATALKKWLVDRLLASTVSVHELGEFAETLFTVPGVSESFAGVQEGLARIVGRIVKTDLFVGVRLANEALTNASGGALDRFFQTFAEYIDEGNVSEIANMSLPTLAASVRARPSLLRLNGLWCTDPSTMHVVADLLNDVKVVPESSLADCVDSFLTGCSTTAAMALGQPLGRLVGPVLKKLDSGQAEAPALRVIEVLLVGHGQAAAAWCGSNEFSYPTFEVIANGAVLTSDWKRVPADRWRFVTATGTPAAWTSKRGLVAAAFLFAIVLDADPAADGIYDVVPSIFEPIHAAAEADSLPYKAWDMLRPRVPTLSWFLNWDICEQLRRSIVDKWLATEWPVRPLMAATKDPDTFKQVVEYCTDSYDRRPLLRRMAAEISERPESATEDQRWILQHAQVA